MVLLWMCYMTSVFQIGGFVYRKMLGNELLPCFRYRTLQTAMSCRRRHSIPKALLLSLPAHSQNRRILKNHSLRSWRSSFFFSGQYVQYGFRGIEHNTRRSINEECLHSGGMNEYNPRLCNLLHGTSNQCTCYISYVRAQGFCDIYPDVYGTDNMYVLWLSYHQLIPLEHINCLLSPTT